MDSFNVQRSIKENSEEANQFLKELRNWENDMKAKELLSISDNVAECELPSVRNLKKATEKPKEEKAQRISATDYAAWDKYDADSECKKIDRGDVIVNEKMTKDQLRSSQDEAIYHKEMGNRFARDKKWKEALECYSKAIRSYKFDPTFFANRALCNMNLNKFSDAERDCDEALSLDKTYVKALMRRASCRKSLHRLEEARRDWETLLKIQPSNAFYQHELRAICSEIAKPKIFPSTSSVHASPHAPPAREKIPTNLPVERKNSQTLPAGKTDLIPWIYGNEMETVEAAAQPPQSQSKSSLRSVPVKAAEAKQQEISVTPKPLKQPSKSAVVAPKVGSFVVPRNSAQFFATWKLLDEPQKADYLSFIPPEKFPVIFQNCLESNILSEMIQILDKQFTARNSPVFPLLEVFSKIKRFSAVVLFLTSEDAQALQRLMAYCMNRADGSNIEITNVFSLYKSCHMP